LRQRRKDIKDRFMRWFLSLSEQAAPFAVILHAEIFYLRMPSSLSLNDAEVLIIERDVADAFSHDDRSE